MSERERKREGERRERWLRWGLKFYPIIFIDTTKKIQMLSQTTLGSAKIIHLSGIYNYVKRERVGERKRERELQSLTELTPRASW